MPVAKKRVQLVRMPTDLLVLVPQGRACAPGILARGAGLRARRRRSAQNLQIGANGRRICQSQRMQMLPGLRWVSADAARAGWYCRRRTGRLHTLPLTPRKQRSALAAEVLMELVELEAILETNATTDPGIVHQSERTWSALRALGTGIVMQHLTVHPSSLGEIREYAFIVAIVFDFCETEVAAPGMEHSLTLWPANVYLISLTEEALAVLPLHNSVVELVTRSSRGSCSERDPLREGIQSPMSGDQFPCDTGSYTLGGLDENDFDFEYVARNLGVSPRQVKTALLTTALNRTTWSSCPPLLKFKSNRVPPPSRLPSTQAVANPNRMTRAGQIPPGKQGETFHELTDYVILLVPADSYCMSQFLREATPNVRWRSIDQVKSYTDGGSARIQPPRYRRGQIANRLRGGARTSCNPVYCDAEKHSESEVFGWTLSDDSDGKVVGTLIELLGNPGVLPPSFELKPWRPESHINSRRHPSRPSGRISSPNGGFTQCNGKIRGSSARLKKSLFVSRRFIDALKSQNSTDNKSRPRTQNSLFCCSPETRTENNSKHFIFTSSLARSDSLIPVAEPCSAEVLQLWSTTLKTSIVSKSAIEFREDCLITIAAPLSAVRSSPNSESS
ncbi:hypothetical protein B0H13DRAFT_2290624 [Mycena leptocephala]|nr:hypothetical protein B0H13DRAFT_2290624 [Mycena leptocephala]